jgi:hypothetical protein
LGERLTGCLESYAYRSQTGVRANNWSDLAHQDIDVDNGFDLFNECVNIVTSGVEYAELFDLTCMFFNDCNNAIERFAASSLLTRRFNNPVTNFN